MDASLYVNKGKCLPSVGKWWNSSRGGQCQSLLGMWVCNSRAVQGLISLSLPWIGQDKLAVEPLNSLWIQCVRAGKCLESLNLLAERVGKPLAGGNGNWQQVGRGEVRKSLPFLVEPLMLDIPGSENLPFSVLQRPGRDFSEIFMRGFSELPTFGFAAWQVLASLKLNQFSCMLDAVSSLCTRPWDLQLWVCHLKFQLPNKVTARSRAPDSFCSSCVLCRVFTAPVAFQFPSRWAQVCRWLWLLRMRLMKDLCNQFLVKDVKIQNNCKRDEIEKGIIN